MQELLLEIAATVGALTAVGSFLLLIYEQTIGKAKEKRAKQRNDEFKEAVAPINEMLNTLQEDIKDRKRHDDKLDELAAQNSAILESHDVQIKDLRERMIVVEVESGVRRISYVKRGEKQNDE